MIKNIFSVIRHNTRRRKKVSRINEFSEVSLHATTQAQTSSTPVGMKISSNQCNARRQGKVLRIDETQEIKATIHSDISYLDGRSRLRPSNTRFWKFSPAFTMIELLISIAIFTIFITSASAAYLSLVRGQSETNERRKVIAELRHLTDQITDHIRENHVDYWHSYCTPQAQQNSPENPSEFQRAQKNCQTSKLTNGFTDKLVLVSPDGNNKIEFEFKEEYDGTKKLLYIKKSRAFPELTNLLTEKDDFNDALNTYTVNTQNGDFESEFPLPNTQIDYLKFYISPLDDPYASRNFNYSALQFQPQVSFLIKAGIPNPNGPALQPITLQGTVSSRLYSARE
jgi:prepilin-type N-terminal cleavage/methylation domain-containing protein